MMRDRMENEMEKTWTLVLYRDHADGPVAVFSG